jgi:hypothetical protein
VVRADGRCDDAASAGSRGFICWHPTTLRPGDHELYTFTFRVKKSRVGAGRVEAANSWASPPLEKGRNPANDSAVLRITVPGDSGQGGGLPSTGPGITLGALLVGLGAAGAWLARRHRTRFSA